MKLNIINLDGSKAGDITLNADVFGLAPRKDLLQRVVVWQLAKMRGGNAHTQVRSEVSRTTKKLYRQKGTGGARHGSRRANIFVGGAAQFGPRAKSWAFSLNKKVRVLALKTALSTKAAEKQLTVVKNVELKTHKTKDLQAMLAKSGLERATFVVDAMDTNFDRASRNLPFIKVLPTEGVNVYDILRQPNLVLTENAVKMIEARFIGEDVKAKPAAKAPAKKTTAKKEAK